MRLVKGRVADRRVRKLIDRYLKAGALTGDGFEATTEGTPQGGPVSPLFANIFRQQGWDEWVVKAVPPRRQGRGVGTRFAEDVILGVESEADAHRVMEGVPKRCKRFGLTIQPEKTAVIAVRKPPSRAPAARGNATCSALPPIGPSRAVDTGLSSARRSGNVCAG